MFEIPDKLIRQFSERQTKDVQLIAIDGCGGAGKSTFAAELATMLQDSQLVHIDDFYKPKHERVEITDRTPVHSNFEFDRLKQQVLKPLERRSNGHYQKPDGTWADVQPSGYIIVEGLGTLGIVLRDYFDYKIWVDTPEATRRQRGIERDSAQWTEIWDNEYLPQDARYVREQAPQAQADWTLNNN